MGYGSSLWSEQHSTLRCIKTYNVMIHEHIHICRCTPVHCLYVVSHIMYAPSIMVQYCENTNTCLYSYLYVIVTLLYCIYMSYTQVSYWPTRARLLRPLCWEHPRPGDDVKEFQKTADPCSQFLVPVLSVVHADHCVCTPQAQE